MEQKIKIKNSATHCTIDIEGTIGINEAEQFGGSSSSIATYPRLREALEEIAQIEAKEVVVNIRSVGGDVGDALLIYEALAAIDAEVTTICYGYTASAATIIAQAADRGHRHIASSALYLIHRSSVALTGNAVEIEQQADLLRKTDERIAAIYASHGVGSAESYLALMDENGGQGRWLTPEEALDAGLVDAVVDVQSARTFIGNIVGHIASWLGIEPSQLPSVGGGAVSDSPNVADVAVVDAVRHSLIAFDEQQRAIEPTTIEPAEDSPLGAIEPSANELAYTKDAQALQRRLRVER